MNPVLSVVFKRIVPVLFAGIGIVLLWLGIRDVALARASAAWPTVEGTVVESGIERHEGKPRTGPRSTGTGFHVGTGRTRRTTYEAQVVYEYSVDGRDYSADTIGAGPQWAGKHSDAVETKRRFPRGAKVTVHYDPRDPATAVLEPGVRASVWIMPGIGFVFIAVAAVFALFFRGASGASGQPA